MKFYDIDDALQEAIEKAEKPVRLKIEIETGMGFFHRIMDQDIIEANFFGLKEAAGGTSARGELLLNNYYGAYSFIDTGAGSQVKISFSLGDTLSYFQRFIFYIDDKGVQDIKGNGRKKTVYIGLQDLSYKLRRSDEARDWTSPAVFTYSVVCDKTQPEKSLVHGIAQRAGLNETDIDCSTIPVTLPYVQLKHNIWAELSSLASAYRCHLECAPEKPLVFAHSPYQSEKLEVRSEEYSHTFYGNEIFYFRKTESADYYRNTVRLKVNMPVPLEKQEVWQYDDTLGYYIFIDGKEIDVIYVDELETQDEKIFGRPIILDLNRSCFVRNDEEIDKYGTVALNVTSSYFSEYEIDGIYHYEDWAKRELADRLQKAREFIVKTHWALFNARVGAKVKIVLQNEEMAGTINAFSFRYKRDKAFIASFRITEEVRSEE